MRKTISVAQFLEPLCRDFDVTVTIPADFRNDAIELFSGPVWKFEEKADEVPGFIDEFQILEVKYVSAHKECGVYVLDIVAEY